MSPALVAGNARNREQDNAELTAPQLSPALVAGNAENFPAGTTRIIMPQLSPALVAGNARPADGAGQVRIVAAIEPGAGRRERWVAEDPGHRAEVPQLSPALVAGNALSTPCTARRLPCRN